MEIINSVFIHSPKCKPKFTHTAFDGLGYLPFFDFACDFLHLHTFLSIWTLGVVIMSTTFISSRK